MTRVRWCTMFEQSSHDSSRVNSPASPAAPIPEYFASRRTPRIQRLAYAKFQFIPYPQKPFLNHATHLEFQRLVHANISVHFVPSKFPTLIHATHARQGYLGAVGFFQNPDGVTQELFARRTDDGSWSGVVRAIVDACGLL